MAKPPPYVAKRSQSADEIAFRRELANVLAGIVCHSLYILRGIRANGRITETGAEATKLVERIQSADCLVSAALTPDDKTKLLSIKRLAEEVSKPAAPPPGAKKK
jgi:hypothetical protein